MKLCEKCLINPIRYGDHFCSRSCSNSAMPRRKPQGSCRACKAPIRTIAKFCSRQCKTIYAGRVTISPAVKRARSVSGVVTWRKRIKIRAVELLGEASPWFGVSPATFHVEAYLRLLARQVETLLAPFGYNEERVMAWLSGRGRL